jgi:hypothetical protein
MIAYILTDRAKAGGMIAYPLTDRALGTGGSHFVSIDLPPNTGSSDAFMTSGGLFCPPITLSFQGLFQTDSEEYRDLSVTGVVLYLKLGN